MQLLFKKAKHRRDSSLLNSVQKSLRSISKTHFYNLHSIEQYAPEYQIGLNSFYTYFDLISFLKIGWKVWICQCILQQVHTLMKQEKSERCLKVEGIEPSAPWYCRRIFKVGHQKPTNFTFAGSWIRILLHRNLSEFAVSYRRSTVQISEKFASCFSWFPWSIQWRFQMIIGKIALSRSAF